MSHKNDSKSGAFYALLCAVILVASSIVGCGTSRPEPAPKGHRISVAVSSPPTPDLFPPMPDATQECRTSLHRIEAATRMWARENRKPDSAVPTQADLVGPDRYLIEKPKCPSGGTYTLGPVGEPPRCSIPGHIY